MPPHVLYPGVGLFGLDTLAALDLVAPVLVGGGCASSAPAMACGVPASGPARAFAVPLRRGNPHT